AMALAKIIPSEFKDRTAYLNLALPQSRFTFYLGKFLAGLTIVLTTFFLVIGLCILITNGKYGTVSSKDLLNAMILIFGGLFALCGIIYGMSIFFKKGNTILPFIILFMIIPIAIAFLSWKYNFQDLKGYVPVFAGDYALTLLGDIGSQVSMGSAIGVISNETMPNITLAFITYIIWGIAFLALGYYFFKRREM
ncbi:MAG: ABC transporter permease, partial [Candidatus Methanomethylophilaceae archaeon]|nr:ABC transporter permease [Candidatus Methanomethylophilaceae archaeon]